MVAANYGVTINSKDEIVAYPQIQDALMVGLELPLPQAKKVALTGNLKCSTERNITFWKIKVSQAILEDCTKHHDSVHETHFFRLDRTKATNVLANP